jgi:hypothetical protein
MSSIALNPVASPWGTLDQDWLRSRPFDLTLIAGSAAIALASGAIVTAQPALFSLVLFADLWLLGYHHVVSTFTRLTFDLQSFRQHRSMVIWLPLFVVALVVALATAFGLWSISTIFLYWQWFHYTRQSYGISQAYRAKAKGAVTEDGTLFKMMFYAVPIWGILHRSAQAPDRFLGLPIKVLPVPAIVADAVGVIAFSLMVYWLVLKAIAVWQHRLPVAHTMYMLSHYATFLTGYIAIENINHGWLVLNIWHNGQYVLFVWLFNNNRFKNTVDPQHRFLSTLSLRKNIAWYFIACLAISTSVYVSLNAVIAAFTTAMLPVIVAAYQVINFHHYIVDAMIWKRRKSAAHSKGNVLAHSGAAA